MLERYKYPMWLGKNDKICLDRLLRGNYSNVFNSAFTCPAHFYHKCNHLSLNFNNNWRRNSVTGFKDYSAWSFRVVTRETRVKRGNSIATHQRSEWQTPGEPKLLQANWVAHILGHMSIGMKPPWVKGVWMYFWTNIRQTRKSSSLPSDTD